MLWLVVTAELRGVTVVGVVGRGGRNRSVGCWLLLLLLLMLGIVLLLLRLESIGEERRLLLLLLLLVVTVKAGLGLARVEEGTCRTVLAVGEVAARDRLADIGWREVGLLLLLGVELRRVELGRRHVVLLVTHKLGW